MGFRELACSAPKASRRGSAAASFRKLSASAGYDRALASEFSGLFDSQTAETDDNGFADLPFGRANTFRISLTLSQNLYTGGRLRAQTAIAGAQARGRRPRRLHGAGTAAVRRDAGVLRRRAQRPLVRIAEAAREQADATLRQTQAGFDAGTQPEFEVVRARVARDSQTPFVIRQRVNREIALLRLKQLLDLPQDFNLRLGRRPRRRAARRRRRRLRRSVVPLEMSLAVSDPAAASVAPRPASRFRNGGWSMRPRPPSVCVKPRCS